MRNTADSNSMWSSPVPETASTATKYLQNLWDEAEAVRLSAHPLELLRYRSNLLGADLRITNFGGGNTSSKFTLPDPLTGQPVRVLAVKGSGGDLRSIGTSGFAVLYLDKLEQLIARYRGEAHEDEMVALLSAVRVRREPRGGVDRHAAARVPAVRPRRPPAPGLVHRAGRKRQRREEAGGVQRSIRAAASSGCPGSGPASSWASCCAARWKSIRDATASCSAATGSSPGARRSMTAM